jgi:hypothetical protein
MHYGARNSGRVHYGGRVRGCRAPVGHGAAAVRPTDSTTHSGRSPLWVVLSGLSPDPPPAPRPFGPGRRATPPLTTGHKKTRNRPFFG